MFSLDFFPPRMDFRNIFAYFIFTSCLVAGEPPIYGLQGEAVEFTTNIQNTPDDILWKHKGNKVIEFNGNAEMQYGSFENRLTLNWHSADLKIEGLTFEDSGDYELEVFTNKELHRISYKLQVIDKVAEPTVICYMSRDDSADESGKRATLMCAAESKLLMTFEWSSNGNMHLGQNLTIPLGDEHDGVEHTCTVRNPLSSKSTVFTAKECYSETGGSTALIASLCVLLLILLILGVLLYFLRRKGCFSTAGNTDVEKQSLHDDEANDEVKRPLMDRAPTMPSHQKLGHLNHKESEELTAEGSNEKKDKNKRNLPPPVSASPGLDVSVNNHEPVDEEKVKVATESEDPEKENDALSGKEKDSEIPSPPPVPPKPRSGLDVSVNNHKPVDEEKVKVATESEDPEKENDALSGKEKDSEISSPPPVPPKPRSGLDVSVNGQEAADEDEPTEAAEREDCEGDSSDSEKADDDLSGEPPKPPPVQDLLLNGQEPADDGKLTEATEKEEKENDALPGEDEDTKISSPLPVASKPNSDLDPTENDQETADEDELKHVTKKDDSEDDSNPEKADDVLPDPVRSHGSENEENIKQHTPATVQVGDGKTSSPPPVAPKRNSVRNPPVNNQQPADEDKLKQVTEKEASEGDSTDPEKADDFVAEPVKNLVSKFQRSIKQHTGEVEDSKTSSPPPVAPKRLSVRNPPVNNQQPADEDELKQVTEKEASEGDSTNPEKADDFVPGEVEDSKTSSPPPVAPKRLSVRNPPVNNQQPADEDELKQVTEKEASEGDSTNPEKADDFVPDSKTSSPPPVAPKRLSVRNPPVNNQQPADEDEHKEATAKEASEKKNDGSSKADEEEDEDATLAPVSDASPPAAQPHSTSTQNNPNMAPHGDADKHKEDSSSDEAAKVDAEESVGEAETVVVHNKAPTEVQESPSTTSE